MARRAAVVPDNEIKTLQRLSEEFDIFTGWQTSFAYKHSMKAPGQKDSDAISKRDTFISDSLAAAVSEYASGNQAGAFASLAVATHTEADSLSPAHMSNGKPLTWCYGLAQCDGKNGHTGLGSDSDGLEGADKITDADYDFMDAYIREAYSKMTGKKLSCRYPK